MQVTTPWNFSSDDLRQAFRFMSACRCIISIPIMVLGILICKMINESPYYVLRDTDEGLDPYCIAILNMRDIRGISIDFGTYDTGDTFMPGDDKTIVSFGSVTCPTILVKRVQTATGMTPASLGITSAPTVVKDGCKIVLPFVDTCPEDCCQEECSRSHEKCVCDDCLGVRNMYYPCKDKDDTLRWSEKVRGHCEGYFCTGREACLELFCGTYEEKREHCKACTRGGRRYLLVNGHAGAQVSLRGMCGGDAPGLWMRGNEKGFSEGPLIASLVVWFLFRSWVQPLVDGDCMHIGKSEPKYIALIDFIVNSWLTSIFISPIQLLQVSNDCPQLLTTYFSWLTQTLLAVGGGTMIVIHIFTASFHLKPSFGHILAGKKYRDYRVSLCVYVPLIVMILSAVAYKITLIIRASVFEIFTYTLDLSIRWPAFDLSAKLNAFHILTFLLFVLDVFAFALAIIKICARRVDHSTTISIEIGDPVVHGRPAGDHFGRAP